MSVFKILGTPFVKVVVGLYYATTTGLTLGTRVSRRILRNDLPSLAPTTQE